MKPAARIRPAPRSAPVDTRGSGGSRGKRRVIEAGFDNVRVRRGGYVELSGLVPRASVPGDEGKRFGVHRRLPILNY